MMLYKNLVVCPYCNYKHSDLDHDDFIEWIGNVFSCLKCNETLIVEVQVIKEFTCYKNEDYED